MKISNSLYLEWLILNHLSLFLGLTGKGLDMIDGFTAKTALHTADVLSDPELPTAEKELLVNGGRLQPGCYVQSKDETDIKKRKKLHHITKIDQIRLLLLPIFV